VIGGWSGKLAKGKETSKEKGGLIRVGEGTLGCSTCNDAFWGKDGRREGVDGQNSLMFAGKKGNGSSVVVLRKKKLVTIVRRGEFTPFVGGGERGKVP